ncbi:hypothetical protein AQUCO_08700006v1 [Aquilegia coerulea]|nr:hypothetical protein AQUCO_08700006v1 [Aquilegia coerulea]
MASSHWRLDLHWAQGAPGLRMNMGMTANSALHLPILPNSPWLLGNAEQHGLQPGPNWPISGSSSSGFAYVNHANPLVIPKGWRVGDWICNCGFHNYSSRAECKKCNASLPSSTISSIANKVTGLYQPHGTKRLASEEFFGEWDNKRLNAGDINNPFLTNQQHSYHKHEQIGRSNNDQASGLYPYPSGNTATSLNSQVSIQLPQLAPVPTLLGKG